MITSHSSQSATAYSIHIILHQISPRVFKQGKESTDRGHFLINPIGYSLRKDITAYFCCLLLNFYFVDRWSQTIRPKMYSSRQYGLAVVLLSLLKVSFVVIFLFLPILFNPLSSDFRKGFKLPIHFYVKKRLKVWSAFCSHYFCEMFLPLLFRPFIVNLTMFRTVKQAIHMIRLLYKYFQYTMHKYASFILSAKMIDQSHRKRVLFISCQHHWHYKIYIKNLISIRLTLWKRCLLKSSCFCSLEFQIQQHQQQQSNKVLRRNRVKKRLSKKKKVKRRNYLINVWKMAIRLHLIALACLPVYAYNGHVNVHISLAEIWFSYMNRTFSFY